MANHPSAIKRAKQNEKRSLRNTHIKSTVKSCVKKVRAAIETEDKGQAEKALLEAAPEIQKARSRHVLHRNTVARKISRLARKVNTMKSVS